MGSIELKTAILTGFVGGLIMVLAEGAALHQKLSSYRTHLRGLHHAKRFFRLRGNLQHRFCRADPAGDRFHAGDVST